jgi:hypothetical protein
MHPDGQRDAGRAGEVIKRVVAGTVLAVICAFVLGPGNSQASLDPAFGPSKDLWVPREVLRTLPTSGNAWADLAADARADWGVANISDQDSRHDVYTFAGALYAVRTNDVVMRSRVIGAIENAIGTEAGGRTLALGRNLTAYVLAADLIGYRSQRLVDWLSSVRYEQLDIRNLIETHEDRPNNWGTHAGAARIAVDLFLGDQADLDAAVRVFRGYLGDRTAYAGFTFGDSEWQADPSAPVPINPAGATKNGYIVDGAIVDDIRRCGCPVSYPPPQEKYQWEAMQGIVTQATLLDNAGYDSVWTWSDAAIRRAVNFLYVYANYPAPGDNNFLTYLIDAGLGTQTSTGVDARSGQSIGYTDWTHARIVPPGGTNPPGGTAPPSGVATVGQPAKRGSAHPVPAGGEAPG